MSQIDLGEAAPSNPVKVFLSYAHEDEVLRKKLETHTSALKRTGWVGEWHDRKIVPGQSWADQIDQNLECADVILLLVSPDFVASDYCHEVETKRALERHREGKAVVILIMLRPTDIEGLPFAAIQGLPTDMKPVTEWPNEDNAFLDVVKGLRRAISQLRALGSLVSAAAQLENASLQVPTTQVTAREPYSVDRPASIPLLPEHAPPVGRVQRSGVNRGEEMGGHRELR